MDGPSGRRAAARRLEGLSYVINTSENDPRTPAGPRLGQGWCANLWSFKLSGPSPLLVRSAMMAHPLIACAVSPGMFGSSRTEAVAYFGFGDLLDVSFRVWVWGMGRPVLGNPPPPPAHVVPRPARPRGRAADGRYQSWEILDEEGALVGYIRHNTGANSLDAHCSAHAGGRLDCAVLMSIICHKLFLSDLPPRPPFTHSTPRSLYRWLRRMTDVLPKVNRTYLRAPTAKSRLARGRPLGFLIAWLRSQWRFPKGPGGRNAHHAVSKSLEAPCEFLCSGLSAERQAGRAFATAHLPLNLEAPTRPGEGEEPDGVP
jgi:hypothetical protein